jgi:hypothetical protein
MWDELGARRKEQAERVLKEAGLSVKDVQVSNNPYESRWDVMYRFATGVHFTVADVLSAIKDKESNMFPTFWIPAPELGPREGYSYQYKYAQNGT